MITTCRKHQLKQTPITTSYLEVQIYLICLCNPCKYRLHKKLYSILSVSEITTPNKDHQGVSKTVHSHVSKLHGLLNDWMKIRDKGVRLCRAISALKLHECDDDYYPSQLKQLMEGLLDALDGLKNVVDGK